MKLKPYFPLLLIIALGAFLRFFNLGSLPVSPNWDEVSHGYNAYSILKTGMDEWGRSFPLIFRAFGDYKLPVYIYLSVIPVQLFGLSVFAIRFISALAGTLAIPGIYLLSKELILNSQFSIISKDHNENKYSKLKSTIYHLPSIAAFLLTISPWHFFISRPALEANLALTLIIFGAFYLLRYYKERSSLLPAVILLGLSLHTYNTARVFVPLLVFFSWLIYRPKIKVNFSFLLSVIFTLLFAGLVLFQVYIGEGTARYEKLKILSPAAVFQLGEQRAESSLPPILSKLLINRPLYFITTAGKNYLSYFSPAFFSQAWGAQSQFAIPGQNLLSLPVYLLAVLGFFIHLSSLRAQRGNPETPTSFRFLYLWLFLSPLAASLTIDPPQALRPNPMIPPLLIMASLAIVFILKKISEKYLMTISVLLFTWISLSFAGYFLRYSTAYKTNYSSAWQCGYAEVMNFVKLHDSEYDKVFITKRYGEPHIFYAFMTGLEPGLLQPGVDNIRFERSGWFWTDKIGKVYFVNDWQIPVTPVAGLTLESGGTISTARSLLITSPDHLPVNAHLIETIYFLDGTPAYIISSIP